MAAAKFLGGNRNMLPKEFGINIAVSPGVHDVNQQERELTEAIEFFLSEDVFSNLVHAQSQLPKYGR